jgi:hypothetical protein
MFSTLEFEFIQGRIVADRNELQRFLSEYIEDFCNTERFLSTIQMKSPIEFEIAFHSKRVAAQSTCPRNGGKLIASTRSIKAPSRPRAW